MAGDGGPALDAGAIAALSQPGAYPHDPSAAEGIERIETHLSEVFLSRDRVCKFRKPVDLGFVCFTSRAERNADCLREVALNRRLAPDVYLGVAPLVWRRGRPVVGPASETLADDELEHCVVMRRLPEGRDALSLLEAGALSHDQVDRLARVIARFHAAHSLGTPAPISPEDWRARCTDPVAQNLVHLEAAGEELAPRAELALLRRRVQDFETRHAERFECRRLDGRAVDAHGDLHLQHVWFERDDAPPVVIDGLEFSESLRCIDAASEVAFTAMDLRYRGATVLAERFLRDYAGECDDFDLYGVVDYFASYRAAVRAKVAAIAARDRSIEAEQRERAARSVQRHLALAVRLLAPPGTGRLVLVGGLVGSGKTTLAGEIAQGAGGVVVSSDRVRKQRLGLTAAQPAPPECYTPQAKAEVYRALLDRAAPILASGRTAILDASWGARRERDTARDFAAARGVPAIFFEARCAAECARRRLARRCREGRDASDAGPALLEASAAGWEPVQEWPVGTRRCVNTDREGWRAEARAAALRLAAGGELP